MRSSFHSHFCTKNTMFFSQSKLNVIEISVKSTWYRTYLTIPMPYLLYNLMSVFQRVLDWLAKYLIDLIAYLHLTRYWDFSLLRWRKSSHDWCCQTIFSLNNRVGNFRRLFKSIIFLLLVSSSICWIWPNQRRRATMARHHA